MCQINKLLFIYLCLNVVKSSDEDYNLTRFRRHGRGCKLPGHPEHGRWKVADSSYPYKPKMTAPVNKAVYVECEDGYHLVGSRTIACIDNSWNDVLGQCQKKCPPRYNTTSVSVTCTYNTVPLRNCENPVENTKATFQCADFHEDLSLNRHPVHICVDGKWSHDFPECEPRCGEKTVKDPTLIINGVDVAKGDFPWQAAIYNITNKQLICGGSLINQKMILTAAHCLAEEGGAHYPEDIYLVAVGKYYRQIDDPRDRDSAQFSSVQHIFTPTKYTGDTKHYEADIGIIITKKTFRLSFTVQPVCVDWRLDHDNSLTSDLQTLSGYVTGWGYTSESKNPAEELKQIELPLVPYNNCKTVLPEDFQVYLLTGDKLCAGFLNSGMSVCKGDSGGGLVFKYGLKYYIMGIVSVSPRSDRSEGGCNSQQYSLYTSVSKYIRDFILEKEAQFRPTSTNFVDCEDNCTSPTRPTVTSTTTPKTTIEIPKGYCVLPQHPSFGHWSVLGKSGNLSAGIPVPSGTFLQITCNDGFELDGTIIITCRNGEWSEKNLQCLKICPPLLDTETTSVTCTFKNDPVDCENAVDGTIAKYRCADFYEDPQFEKNPRRVCRSGSWDQKVPECVPICGRKSAKAIPLIYGGQIVKQGDYPWVVTIYQRQNFVCSGSLLNQRVILTSAQCVTKSNGIIESKKKFKAAAGKYYPGFNDPRDHQAQFSKLITMFVPNTFARSPSDSYGDIAILVTRDSFKLSTLVQPVCVDWSLQYQTEFADSSGLHGYIAGFGFYGSTKKNPKERSDELKDLEVPIVPRNVCLNSLPEGYYPASPQDKICAGYKNEGRSVCKGDEGGGLVLKHNDRYYISGVLCIVPRKLEYKNCNTDSYAYYTNISYHIDFILEKEAKYRNPHRPNYDARDCRTQSKYCLKISNRTETEAEELGCTLPEYPIGHGHWSIIGSNTSTGLPGERTALGTIIEIHCQEGLKLDSDSYLLCTKKGWNSKIARCLEHCPSLFSTLTTKVNCVFQGKIIKNCAEPLDGTIVKYECSPFYEFPVSSRAPTLICKNGSWNPKPFECVPICGHQTVSTLSIEGNATKTKRNYPWHVGIYKKYQSAFSYICGGTLISARVILTAAECVKCFPEEWVSTDNYLVAVGKYYQKYDDIRDLNDQFSPLQAIFVPNQFKRLNYEANIAVLVTSNTFLLSPTVQPVCVDWNLKFETKLTRLFKTQDYIGYVPGWHYAKSANFSDKLVEIKVPGINHDDCVDKVSGIFEWYLTFDKFCGGYLNDGPSVCKADTGGGLVFNHDGKYYITGILNLSPATTGENCDGQHYSFYTKVCTYADFIADKIARYK